MSQSFPLDATIAIGAKYRCRLIQKIGDCESDHKFGPWKDYEAWHIQRDRKGKVACVAFRAVDDASPAGEFDPRNDWENTNAGQFGCLVTERVELQFSDYRNER